MSAVTNIETLKGPFIEHKFSTGWAVGVVKSEAERKTGKEEITDHNSYWPA